MYYESRVHELISTEGADDAALKIKNGTIHGHQVATWAGEDKQYQFYAVPDGHVDNPLLELAILRKKITSADSGYQQVESITNGWIGSPEMLSKYLLEAETSEWIMASNAQLLTGSPKGNETANFTCLDVAVHGLRIISNISWNSVKTQATAFVKVVKDTTNKNRGLRPLFYSFPIISQRYTFYHF